jgi:hypothetical protein
MSRVRPGGVSRKDKSSRRSDAQSASTRSGASPFRSAPIHRYTATLESVSRTRYVFAGSERRYRERYTEPLGPRATSPPRPSASALLAFSDRRGYSLPSHAHRVAECGKCDAPLGLEARSGMPQSQLQSLSGRPQSRNWCGLAPFDCRSVALSPGDCESRQTLHSAKPVRRA